MPTNRLLYQMKKIASDKCDFCFLQKETLYHLFFECVKLRSLWFYVEEQCKYLCNETCKDVILGYKFNENLNDKQVMINKIILYCKYYVWKSKKIDQIPSVQGFKSALEQHKIFDSALHKYINT